MIKIFPLFYFRFLYRYVNAGLETRRFVQNDSTVMKLFRERARLYPNKPCFIFEGRIWTNADVSKLCNYNSRKKLFIVTIAASRSK